MTEKQPLLCRVGSRVHRQAPKSGKEDSGRPSDRNRKGVIDSRQEWGKGRAVKPDYKFSDNAHLELIPVSKN